MTSVESKHDVGNIVDQASSAADRLLAATQRKADSAIGGMSDRLHAVRDLASPALNRALAPADSLVLRTQAAPLKSLVLAAAAGAALMAVVGAMRSSRHR